MFARLSCTRKRKVKVWFQRDQSVPTKIKIDSDSDIDDLKQDIFGTTEKEQYQTTYKDKTLKLWTKVPKKATHDKPIVFTRIVNIPSQKSEEFAAPGTGKGLSCTGRPCAKCHKCRDWHFTGDQGTWNWVCSWKNWTQADKDRFNDGDYKLFLKHDGATCSLYNNSDNLLPYRADDDRVRRLRSYDDDRRFVGLLLDLGLGDPHVCLCEQH
ncbi:unnamed protein product [Adineta steineri]|uniref:Uncharacterized protein n=2 Tax=Adineta steineri TaxID=433720 RepID=A0A813S8S0_9BILA|nr:unnamed protein product [Adineta steineri]CAF0792812.1 unnamed protein product [Adineta steineri]CAF3649500.1 unnamed protein product [Adineta steineri]